MADPDHWKHAIGRLLTHCTRVWGGVTGASRRLAESLLQFELPGTGLLERLHGGREIPERSRLFLQCVNILTVALVMVLTMEDACGNDTQLQEDRNQHEQPQTRTGSGDDIEGQAEDLGDVTADEQLAAEETLASIKEEPETSENSDEAVEWAEVIGAGCGDCRAVCTDCKAIARKAVLLLTECGYCGGQEHTVRQTDCKVCGGTDEGSNEYRVESPSFVSETGCTSRGGLEEATQGENFKESPVVDLGGEEFNELPAGSQVYWRNRVLDILSPSLPPLPNACDLFSGNMNGISHHTSVNLADSEGRPDNGTARAAAQIIEGGELENESAHDRSHRNQDGSHDGSPPTVAGIASLEAAVERARERARYHRIDALNYSSSLGHQYPNPTHAMLGYLPASLPSPRPASPDNNSRSQGGRARPLSPPRQLPRGGHVFPYNQTQALQFNSAGRRSQFSNAPHLPGYYYNNRDLHPTAWFYPGAFPHSQRGNGPSQPSSSGNDDADQFGSQSSTSSSARSYTMSSSSRPLDRPQLHNSSLAHRERCRSRPRGRILARRHPRCGLMMVTALRNDPACVPEEGKTIRKPGHEDKLFSPRRGDVILRHMILPGRGVVEVYFPGVEEHLQNGDCLVRLKMDNMSYPTMLIIRAKAFLFLQGKWVYLGRHQHGVRKPKRERILGRN